MVKTHELTGKIESFDTFWEAPEDIEKGFRTIATFYRYNYLKHVPQNRKSRVLVINCGAV